MKPHHRIILLCVAGNFAIMAFGDIYFLLALYLKQFGLTDPGVTGWILGVYFAASTISRPLTGFIIERFEFRPVLLAASVMCFASGAGVALAGTSATLLLVARALTGFFASLFVIGLTTYQTLAIPEEIRGSSFTLATAGTIAPLVAVVPFAEWLLRAGHTTLYIWSPLVFSLMCVAVSLSLETGDGISLRGGKWGSYREVFRNPALRTLFVSVMLFASTDATIVSMAGLALEKSLTASAFISAQALTAVVIRLFGFRLMDRIPRSRIAPLTFAVTAASLIAITFVHTDLGMIVWGVVFGVAMGYGFPLHLSLIGDAAPERLRPKATSMVWFFMAGCFFVSPVVTGFLAGLMSFSAAFRIMSGAILVSAPFMYLRFRRTFV